MRRTKRLRILPEMVARTWCLLSNSTRNMVPASTVRMRPSTSMCSSICLSCERAICLSRLHPADRQAETHLIKQKGAARSSRTPPLRKQSETPANDYDHRQIPGADHVNHQRVVLPLAGLC